MDFTRDRGSETKESRRVVEFRSYRLLPGSNEEFERLFREEAQPMLRRCAVDVVAFRRSLDDANAFVLVRAFDSLDHRQRSEDAFYGSDDWRHGPREPIIALIETYIDIVLELDGTTIDGLRQ